MLYNNIVTLYICSCSLSNSKIYDFLQLHKTPKTMRFEFKPTFVYNTSVFYPFVRSPVIKINKMIIKFNLDIDNNPIILLLFNI